MFVIDWLGSSFPMYGAGFTIEGASHGYGWTVAVVWGGNWQVLMNEDGGERVMTLRQARALASLLVDKSNQARNLNLAEHADVAVIMALDPTPEPPASRPASKGLTREQWAVLHDKVARLLSCSGLLPFNDCKGLAARTVETVREVMAAPPTPPADAGTGVAS